MKCFSQYFPFFVFLLFFGSCSKEDIAATADVCIDNVCVEGEWNWFESSGSIAGVTITPQTEMIERKLTIDEDYFREYVDGALVLETEYEYVKTNELNSFTTDSLVLKLESGNWYAVFVKESKLILAEPCADCWTHIYNKN